jgi:hypothetical protein
MLKMNAKCSLRLITLMLFSLVLISAKAQNNIRLMQQPAIKAIKKAL